MYSYFVEFRIVSLWDNALQTHDPVFVRVVPEFCADGSEYDVCVHAVHRFDGTAHAHYQTIGLCR